MQIFLIIILAMFWILSGITGWVFSVKSTGGEVTIIDIVGLIVLIICGPCSLMPILGDKVIYKFKDK